MSSQEPADPTRRAESDAPAGPVPCLGGCGFYGRSETAGYCSVCYQKHGAASAAAATTGDSTADSSGDTAVTSSAAASDGGSAVSAMAVDSGGGGGDSAMDSGGGAAATAERPVQTKLHRCWQCSKKIKPAGRFKCKCGYTFCGKHRYADAHDCDFDYRKEHSDKLAKLNPEVAPDKLQRI